MQLKINNNVNNMAGDGGCTSLNIVRYFSLLLLLSLSFLLNNKAMAYESASWEDERYYYNHNNKRGKENNNGKKFYNAFSVGYKFNHFSSDEAMLLSEDGHGFSMSYDRDFVHRGIFSFGMSLGYDFGVYKDKTATYWIDMGGGDTIKLTAEQSFTLNEVDINFNFAFALSRKLKLIIQMGAGADIYVTVGMVSARGFENSTDLVAAAFEVFDGISLAFSVNTNVGFDYDINDKFAIRALFKSSYCSSMKGIDPSLGAVAAIKWSF